MFEVLILVLKVILIAAFALYFGKTTGLFVIFSENPSVYLVAWSYMLGFRSEAFV